MRHLCGGLPNGVPCDGPARSLAGPSRRLRELRRVRGSVPRRSATARTCARVECELRYARCVVSREPFMPIHDWTQVNAGIFHDFHSGWIIKLRTTLNAGLLPSGYYALAEQVTRPFGPDVLTLQANGQTKPSGK